MIHTSDGESFEDEVGHVFGPDLMADVKDTKMPVLEIAPTQKQEFKKGIESDRDLQETKDLLFDMHQQNQNFENARTMGLGPSSSDKILNEWGSKPLRDDDASSFTPASDRFGWNRIAMEPFGGNIVPMRNPANDNKPISPDQWLRMHPNVSPPIPPPKKAETESMTHTSSVTGNEPTPLLQALAAKLKETNDTIGDLMTGRIDPASEEGIKKVTHLAANTMGMGAFGAESAALGIFGGRMSQAAVKTAELLEKQNLDPLAIKRWTGLERGAEGMWRKELSDEKAKLNLPLDVNKENKTASAYHIKTPLKNGSYKLGDILDHPELYKAYPEAKNLPVYVKHMNHSARGQYSLDSVGADASFINLNSRVLKDKEQAKSTLLHEIQHYIQHKEGFSLGTPAKETEDAIVGKIIRDEPSLRNTARAAMNLGTTGSAHDLDEGKALAADTIKTARAESYLRRAHEVEARNVQARAGMTKEQRNKALAQDTEDVDRLKQFLNDLEGGVSEGGFTVMRR